MTICRKLFMATMLSFSTAVFALAAIKTEKQVFYTDEQPNITVAAAQPFFTIKLKSNPSTGYAWFLKEHDDAIIQPMKHIYEKSDKKGLIGAPGFELWTFKIKPEGFTVPQQTAIRMIYARPNQGSEGSSQLVFRITTVAK